MDQDLDRALTSPVERVARVLAGHALSHNAEGDMTSAGEAVDVLWPDYSAAALAVLRTCASRALRCWRSAMPNLGLPRNVRSLV